MTERPILFSGEMVRAILAGKKTQTRRVIKPQPDKVSKDGKALKYKQITVVRDNCIEHIDHPDGQPGKRFVDILRCPYGYPGDRLWVRETWMPYTEGGVPTGEAIYRATDKPEQDGDYPLLWRPSIYMPREYSRITLEVVSVRVERLQEISEADCCAETGALVTWPGPGPEPYKRDMRGAFAILWDSINAKRGYGWDVNPWVFVIDFQRVL